MQSVLREVRQAGRSLGRNPGFTAAAVACLGLGIGAMTAIFSVVNGVLLQPLAYGKPEGLVRLYTEFPTFPGGGLKKFWTSGPEFFELRRDLKQWQTLDAWRLSGVNLAGTGEPVRATAGFVSGTLLKTLGVKPQMGRLLTQEDDVPGAPRVAVISSELWMRAFGGDAGVLTREVRLDGQKTNVVGVMPAGFQFPPGETEPPELWTPLQLDPARPGGRGGHNFYILG
ncbi:MAG: ABC transporter permease, partial [Acidobacteria bacterium]|nr:ABC transporter permease [Acidobacteriota bacterium]